MFQTIPQRIVAALLACALCGGAAAGPSLPTRTATGSVTISKAISASRTRILNFGLFTIVGGDKCIPSTITLEPRAGARRTTGSVSLTGETATFGAYAITGAANSVYGVSFPATTVSSPHALKVTAFRFYSATSNGAMTGKIGPDGTDTPHVGATISVPCDFNTNDINEGVPSFTLTVTYQ
jgi:hypothetical protein